MEATYEDHVAALGGLLDAHARAMLEANSGCRDAAIRRQQEAREMTESFWRTFLDMNVREPARALAFAEAFTEMLARNARITNAASRGNVGTQFQAMIQYERDRLATEYEAGPVAQSVRLGGVGAVPIGKAGTVSRVQLALAWQRACDAIRAFVK